MLSFPVIVTATMLLMLLTSSAGVDAAAAGPYETRSSRGEIAFDLTPREPVDGRFTIDIRANTHSGDLADLDLSEVVALEAGGKTYHPARVTRLSGHHASGTVTFEVPRVPARFVVTMTGVRSMGELRFEWP